MPQQGSGHHQGRASWADQRPKSLPRWALDGGAIFVWAWNLWSVHHVDGWVWLQILGSNVFLCFFLEDTVTSTNSCEGRMRWFRTAFGDSAALRCKTNLWVVNLHVNKHVSKRSPKSKQNLISSKKPSPLQCVQFQSNHPFQWNHTWSHDPCPQGLELDCKNARIDARMTYEDDELLIFRSWRPCNLEFSMVSIAHSLNISFGFYLNPLTTSGSCTPKVFGYQVSVCDHRNQADQASSNSSSGGPSPAL